jgi:hypothetical protein
MLIIQQRVIAMITFEVVVKLIGVPCGFAAFLLAAQMAGGLVLR